MPAQLTLNTDQGPDGTPWVTATGEIDLSNVAQLVEALNTASAGTRSPITIDLRTVKYLDSAGINALFDHADKVDGLHVIVHRLLVRVLTISGLDKVATLEAASAGDAG
ncbi:MAG: STAS domain-containing protein [Actinomycetota bacterium]|uniref:STAS domain-containing protein n=1 Tax=Mycobacterium lentiflavum TaxID=141349 RepID=A0ABY3UMU6_MYCLN|nr:STAS domain-containing protein [Mycobacterium lentiflavum]MEE3063990.1 STAS domain-containing protein [Actinomycetota bacterium]ULP40774.1 STAS domain-containing protein [Mycobacterium lentiflavum]